MSCKKWALNKYGSSVPSSIYVISSNQKGSQKLTLDKLDIWTDNVKKLDFTRGLPKGNLYTANK